MAADASQWRRWPSLGESAVRVGDETLSYSDLLVVGAVTGALQEAVDRSLAGAVALARSGGDSVTAQALRSSAVAFRRTNRLESGTDFGRWLGERALTTEDFRDHLRRQIASLEDQVASLEDEVARLEVTTASLGAGTVPDGGRRSAGNGHDVLTQEVIGADLALSEAWLTFAQEAVELCTAERLVAAASGEAPATTGTVHALTASLSHFGHLDPGWLKARLELFRRRQACRVALTDSIETSDRVTREIAERVLDWTAYRYDELVLRSTSTAMEALSCVHHDGLSAGEVAQRAKGNLEERSALREQLPPRLSALLDSAQEGEVAGPLEQTSGVSVIWLRQRQRPSPEDPGSRRRAVAKLSKEMLADAAVGTVTRLGPL